MNTNREDIKVIVFIHTITFDVFCVVINFI